MRNRVVHTSRTYTCWLCIRYGRLRLYIIAFPICMVLLHSCTFDDEPGVCPYNIRLDYWYAESTANNLLPMFVDKLDEYLFRDDELVRVRTLRDDSLMGYREQLPPGEYTVVLWGNRGTNAYASVPLPSKNARLSNMFLSTARDTIPPGYHENTERLYYGNSSFTIVEGVTTASRVDVCHAHNRLKISVSWAKDVERPSFEGGRLRMRLRGIPSQYGYRVGKNLPGSSKDQPYTIPVIRSAYTNHEVTATYDYSGDVTGEFVTYRYTDGTHPVWSLWCGKRMLVKELDLERYFRKAAIGMDNNKRQEFHLLVMVEKDQIVVIEAAGSDWEEGGEIG